MTPPSNWRYSKTPLLIPNHGRGVRNGVKRFHQRASHLEACERPDSILIVISLEYRCAHPRPEMIRRHGPLGKTSSEHTRLQLMPYDFGIWD